MKNVDVALKLSLALTQGKRNSKDASFNPSPVSWHFGQFSRFLRIDSNRPLGFGIPQVRVMETLLAAA